MHGVDSKGCLFFIAFLAVGAALSSIGAEWLLGVGGVFLLILVFREMDLLNPPNRQEDWDGSVFSDDDDEE